ncbi:MAG TPA: hypothetical protein VEK38_01620 [Candidatus Bathyarchaeia archaeon]|nr:hypothetical protein [Candidatus Bathyarchaeia archaeon]
MIFFIFILLFNFCLNGSHFLDQSLIKRNKKCPPHDTCTKDSLATISGWLRTNAYGKYASTAFFSSSRPIFTEDHIALTDNKKQIDTGNCDILIRQTLRKITHEIAYLQHAIKLRPLHCVNLPDLERSFFFGTCPILTQLKNQLIPTLLQLKEKMEQEKTYISSLAGKNTHTEQDMLRIFRFLKIRHIHTTQNPSQLIGVSIFIEEKDDQWTYVFLRGKAASILDDHIYWDLVEKKAWTRLTPHPKGYVLPWYHPNYIAKDNNHNQYGPFFRQVLSAEEEIAHEKDNFVSKITQNYQLGEDPRTANRFSEKNDQIRALCVLPCTYKSIMETTTRGLVPYESAA